MCVAPRQNVRKKTEAFENVHLHHQNSANLEFEDATFDNVILFFLLYEQPDEIRQKTVREALRAVRPGGKVIFVDYHRPHGFNPFRYIMLPILHFLEPFALDLWKREIADWLPAMDHPQAVKKETFFGSLYQKIVVIK